MYRRCLFLLICSLLIVSGACNSAGPSQPKNVSGDPDVRFRKIRVGEYSMQLPDYMQPSKELNDDASLQYSNGIRELYVVVIDEEKTDVMDAFRNEFVFDSSKSMLKNYAQIQMEQWKDNMTISGQTELKPAVINGLDALRYDLSGKSEDIPQTIYYQFAYVESSDKLYMIVAWTLDSRKAQYSALLDKMIRSFHVYKSRS